MQQLEGKYYELVTAGGSVLARIQINHIREEHIPSKMYDDGSLSEPKTYTMISGDGYTWYRSDRPLARIV